MQPPLLHVFTLDICRLDIAKDFGEKIIPQIASQDLYRNYQEMFWFRAFTKTFWNFFIKSKRCFLSKCVFHFVFCISVCRRQNNNIFNPVFSRALAGFAVTGHVDGAGRSHVYVSEVDPLGLSTREGLKTLLLFLFRLPPTTQAPQSMSAPLT